MVSLPKSFPEERSAGVLMRISSLPGPAFIGDIGPGAFQFAEFLHRTDQTVWQLLPLQPVSMDQGYSPYSSHSAFAGNPLLISPELLLQNGWISAKDIVNTSSKKLVDYPAAEKYKRRLIEKAFTNWKKKSDPTEERDFREFCDVERSWLFDFALYAAIKHHHKERAWYQWPEPLKNRDQAALRSFATAHADELELVQWTQMIFARQWKALKEYCDSLSIRLLGDIPFYVAHDSADVWCNRSIFQLTEQGELAGVAGVPPDFFNSNGQPWGMPLFKWELLEESGYAWWVARLKKNLTYFDVLRLDHFRAFASYWAVPAAAKTAKDGRWEEGPGKKFFECLQNELGSLPFVAEDLGDIDEPVYALRDAVGLPGMNVLQFAFGDDMPHSPYLPHNHHAHALVYTGTHDNDTTAGWYRSASTVEKKNVESYLGAETSARNISDHLRKLAYLSVSKLAIIPTQDHLGLGSGARMNTPASGKNNWQWRLKPGEITTDIEKKIGRQTLLYGRSRT